MGVMKRGTRTLSIAVFGPAFLLCLAAAAQTTNVSWTRQAYGQEWQDGCDEMQGFFFSKPLPVEDCTQFLEGRRNLHAT